MAGASEVLRSPLRFQEEPYTADEASAICASFQTDGFAILPAVYIRSTTAAFRASIVSHLDATPGERQDHKLAAAGDHCRWEPPTAPRIRQITALCLSPRGALTQVTEASLHNNIPKVRFPLIFAHFGLIWTGF